MAQGAEEPATVVMEPSRPDLPPLLKICSLLNAAGAKYLVIGGYAVILHGLVRTTDDVDILIEATEENAVRVWQALDGLRDHAVRELKPPDLLEGVVVVGDEFQVDVSIHAWKVSYADAIGTAREVVLEGVRVPYLGYDMLIASKQTYREKDQLDLLQIRALKERL